MQTDEQRAAINQLHRRATEAADALRRFADSVHSLRSPATPDTRTPTAIANNLLAAGVAFDALKEATALLPLLLQSRQ
jgi:hypothetical protein